MARGHGHVITLTHLGDNAYAICRCGTGSTVMGSQFIGKWITDHRLDHFWYVGYNLYERGQKPASADGELPNRVHYPKRKAFNREGRS